MKQIRSVRYVNFACQGHGCRFGEELVPGNVKGRGFKKMNNVDHFK